MKLEGVLELVVSVKESGSNNVARILGEGITASSTNRPAVAVDVAAEKFMKRNRLNNVKCEYRCTSSSISHSMWIVTISPE
jgi:hypothetical protein